MIDGELYVTYVIYDSQGDETPSGIVDIFDTSGNYISRFSSSAALDAPWGITLAPAAFGGFGGDILVGNFLNGEINAFDPTTGAFVGTLDDSNGNPIADPGLWALDFRTGGTGDNTNALYFTAGINNETDGLFGEIVLTPTPEPAPFLLAGSAILALSFSSASDIPGLVQLRKRLKTRRTLHPKYSRGRSDGKECPAQPGPSLLSEVGRPEGAETIWRNCSFYARKS